MAASKNQAAYLLKAGTPLQVRDAPMPSPGPGELVIKNAAIAINPLDCHMQDVGVFVKQYPAIFGCDIAGFVEEIGEGVDVGRFERGDRVVGHAISLVSGRPEDGAYQLYTVVPADKAAILPDSISFTDGVVVPFALEAAICVLSLKKPGIALPGVATPTLGLPYPSLDPVPGLNKTLVIYGGSSSVGSMTTQLAVAAGIKIIAIVGEHNFAFSKKCGASEVFDHKDASLITKVVNAIGTSEFIGIFDAISSTDTYVHDLAILEKLGGGHLACSHPPPEEVPQNVKAGMIFAVNDVATSVWRDYVTAGLEGGQLKCLPEPMVVGRGLEFVQEGLKKVKEGVSARKVVVEL